MRVVYLHLKAKSEVIKRRIGAKRMRQFEKCPHYIDENYEIIIKEQINASNYQLRESLELACRVLKEMGSENGGRAVLSVNHILKVLE